MEASRTLESALLQWANSFDLPKHITTWQDFKDGTLFWIILGQVEPRYFGGSLPEDAASSLENWVLRWQNLKFVGLKARAYIRDECGTLQNLSSILDPDMKAIATDGSKKDTIKLLQIVLLAAMYSPTSNERMVAMMEVLGPNVAIPIAQCIESIEALGDEDAKELRVSSAGTVQRDPGLEMEEELLRARAVVQDLEVREASLAEELERTQSELAELRQDTAGISLRRRADSAESKENILKQLRNASHLDKEHIADLEAEVAASRVTSEEQERMIDRLRAESQSKQDLRDELQVLKAERDGSVHTARANENLRKKIQSLQETNKAAEALGQDLENARKDVQSLREQCAALEKSNEERQKTIENGEQAISDQRTARKRVDYELKLLAQKVEDATEQRSRDRDTIQEQKDRIRDLESASHNIVSDNLHQELVQDTRVKKLAASMDALRRENEQLTLQLSDSQRGLEEQKELLRNTLSPSSQTGDASSGNLKQSDEYKLIAGQLDTLRRSPDKIDDVARLIVARIHARGQEGDGKKEEILEQNKKHQATITRLEAQLRLAQAAAKARLQSPAEEHLARELSLMSSAWYSLTSRLQSDAVAVQRRSEAPKSFLNRERRLINNPALIKSTDATDLLLTTPRKSSYITPPGAR